MPTLSFEECAEKFSARAGNFVACAGNFVACAGNFLAGIFFKFREFTLILYEVS
tara:strand:+ start:355 stop:516 length:162 start_codon:yes stop_codon:yes gene_type:complete